MFTINKRINEEKYEEIEENFHRFMYPWDILNQIKSNQINALLSMPWWVIHEKIGRCLFMIKSRVKKNKFSFKIWKHINSSVWFECWIQFYNFIILKKPANSDIAHRSSVYISSPSPSTPSPLNTLTLNICCIQNVFNHKW